MRLQLDSVVTGTGTARPEETARTIPAGGSAADSRRIGNDYQGADSIRISGPSSALNTLATQRAARIEQLTGQVQSGTYNVAASAVSKAMIGHAVS